MKRFLENLDPERAVKLVRFAAISIGAVFLLSSSGLGIAYLISKSNASAEETEAKQSEEKSAEIREVLEVARSNAQVSIRNQSKAVAAFQESVSRLAGSSGCRLAEFMASTDFQPYLTRFSKQNDSGGWNQVEIQITFVGPALAVIEVIGKLAEQSVPIEFSTVKVTREKSSQGASTVKANLQLRVLVMAGGQQ